MSEGIKHPPIDLDLMHEASLERDLAEETFQLLDSYGSPYTHTVDGNLHTVSITHWVDLYAEMPEAGSVTSDDDNTIAFRIAEMLSFGSIGNDKDDETPFYYVMELQHGTLDEPACEAPEAEDFTWTPYVRIITNTKDTDDITVIDAQAYKEICVDDLARVLFTVAAMRREFRTIVFEDGMPVASAAIRDTIEPVDDQGYIEFRSGDHYEVTACAMCGTVNQACQHNFFTLN